MMIFRSHAPLEGTPIPYPWVWHHGSMGHENDFSSLLDGLEEDLGVSRVMSPRHQGFSQRHIEKELCHVEGRLGPRFTRRHTAVHPEQVLG